MPTRKPLIAECVDGERRKPMAVTPPALKVSSFQVVPGASPSMLTRPRITRRLLPFPGAL